MSSWLQAQRVTESSEQFAAPRDHMLHSCLTQQVHAYIYAYTQVGKNDAM